jgi:DNA-binding NarL/FixJ family response regulator
MGKRKTTVYLDEDLLRAARVFAARTEMRDSEVVEQALRAYLGIDAFERVWARSDLSEEEALRLAYEALHESRTESRTAAPLTDREMEILTLLGFGSTVGDIAQRLRLAESVVAKALESAAGKLAAQSQTGDLREAAR